MEFQINLGTVPAPPSAPAGRLYASIDGRASSLANGEVVFLDPQTERLHVMTDQVLGALDVCRPFRTLEQHIAAVRAADPKLPAQGDAVRRVLENLIRRGLLQSDEDFLTRLQTGPGVPQAPFEGVFIRACDRPAQLRRLLDSLLDYERRFAPRRRYTVIDDSREAAHVREQRRLLQDFGAAAGVEVRHLGPEEWRRAADLLLHTAAAGDAGERLIGRAPERRPHAGGLGINLILLLAAGRRFALLDDDFVFPLRLHPEHDPRPDLAGRSGVQAQFYADVDAALAAGSEPDGDPIETHLLACGAPLAALINRHPHLRVARQDLRDLVPSTLPQLAPERRIIATANGHRGHSGAAGSGWLFVLDPPSRARLWAEREDYLRQIDSPRLWWGPARARLHAQGNFTAFAVDGSRLLPCTRPTGRAEDQLFAALCRFVWPQSLSLHLPYAVGHRQEAERSRVASLREAFTPRMNDYLSDLALSSVEEFRAEDPGLRLRGFATRLRDLAAASPRDRLGMLTEHLAHARSTLVAQLQAILQSARGAPLFWAADLRQLIEANGKALVQGGAPRLGDWAPDLDAAGCAEQMRVDLEQQAEALDVWPALWAAAEQQRAALAALGA